MDPSRQPGIANFEKLLFIWVVILIVIIATALVVGGQIYWWQRSVAAQKEAALMRKIDHLQNELQVLQKKLAVYEPAPTPKLPPVDQLSKTKLAGVEGKVMRGIRELDFDALAGLVHPEKGVRFSPYASVNSSTDLVFSTGRVKRLSRDGARYSWGYYEGTGLPLRLTFKEYYQQFIYDRDYAITEDVTYNEEVRRSLGVGNLFEIYPNALVAQYQISDPNSPEKPGGWSNLKLVFELQDKIWYLVGIIHDQWRI
ncbi:MAG TPA: hypothetical protein VHY08_27275 [Bacillota bacterium]|nr:hypothetical protein [Bacillota bacterium]